MPGAIRTRSAIFGYLAFVVALLLVVIASSQMIANATVIIGLLATSLPALVAWMYVESIDWEGLESGRRLVRGATSLVALTLSLAGFLLTLWNFSLVAVFVVVFQMAFWYLVIEGVFYLSEEED